MYLLIIFLPLLNAICCGFFGAQLGKIGVIINSIYCLGLTVLIASFICFESLISQSSCYIDLGLWINSNFFNLRWSFLFDSLTVIMLVVISIISFVVHLYSIEYMSFDAHFQRFMAYLSLFTFFMFILVTSNNFLQMFLGWEGVGLCSYLLINFWYGRIQANKASLKAMYVNRFGDFGLAFSIFILFYFFKSFDYEEIFLLIADLQTKLIIFSNWRINMIDFICFFLFIGSVGKSAQLGLHTWLPDAMEGPTPVSALIHAATMVTAGIFLICRCSFLFQFSIHISILIMILGALTAFIMGLIGLVQNDIKRVIAYSTCSQLGYMILACGISSYNASIFHLTTHAFFKALLFLSAGSIIHNFLDEQDMRRMGGIVRLFSYTYGLILIGSLALIGFPFLSGFFSKELILELVFINYTGISLWVYWLGVCAAICTAIYSFRLLYLVFLQKPLGNKQLYILICETRSGFINYSLLILISGSLFIGYLIRDLLVGLGSNFWQNSIFLFPFNNKIFEVEWLLWWIKFIPLLGSFGGLGLVVYCFFYQKQFLISWKNNWWYRRLYIFLNKKWLVDKVYNESLVQNFLHWSYKYFYIIDKGLLELLGPYGISFFIYLKMFSFFKLLSYVLITFIYFCFEMFLFFICCYLYFLLGIGYFYLISYFIELSFLLWFFLIFRYFR